MFMGYTTEFTGKVVFDKEVPKTLVEYLNRLSGTRRMKRDPEKIKVLFKNWKDMCYKGNLGRQGEYFAVKEDDPDYVNYKNSGDSFFSCCAGQARDGSIIDYNEPPVTQPGLWCQWVISPVNPKDMEDETKDTVRAYLEWDGAEKFYCYTEWLKYIIKNFLEPEGITACGAFLAVGEEYGDATYIIVDNNNVSTVDAFNEGASEELCNKLSGDLLKFFLEEVSSAPSQITAEYWDDWYDDDEEDEEED